MLVDVDGSDSLPAIGSFTVCAYNCLEVKNILNNISQITTLQIKTKA